MPREIQIKDQQILEALRNGIPSRAASRFLGTNQEKIDRDFWQKIAFIQNSANEGKQVPGLLIKGDYGTGKSHLLDCLAGRALEENFVCSRVAVSRETPLSHPAKVYLAAIDGALVPGKRGWMIHEVADRLKVGTPIYDQFYLWVNNPANGIGRFFAATLFLHERDQDDEVREGIRNFWSGEDLSLPDMRRRLKQMNYPGWETLVKVKVRDLPHQRFVFAARLILAAGYGGWILMIDEVEQIGRYGFLQRARSYAQLARWLGKSSGHLYPGLMAVATITEDFDLHVLQQKRDRDELASKLRAKETEDREATIGAAEVMMQCIVDKATPTLPKQPGDYVLKVTHDKLREAHSRAYAWEAPLVLSQEGSGTMRDYVRRWIHEWDLKRLYPNEQVRIEQEDQQTGPIYDLDENSVELAHKVQQEH